LGVPDNGNNFVSRWTGRCMGDEQARDKKAGTPFIWDASWHKCNGRVAPDTVECASDNLMRDMYTTHKYILDPTKITPSTLVDQKLISCYNIINPAPK